MAKIWDACSKKSIAASLQVAIAAFHPIWYLTSASANAAAPL